METPSPPQRPMPQPHDPPPGPTQPGPTTPQPAPGEPTPGTQPAHDPPVYPEHNVACWNCEPHSTEILFDESVVPG